MVILMMINANDHDDGIHIHSAMTAGVYYRTAGTVVAFASVISLSRFASSALLQTRLWTLPCIEIPGGERGQVRNL